MSHVNVNGSSRFVDVHLDGAEARPELMPDAGVDGFRVRDVGPVHWAQLRADGYSVGPRWVTWGRRPEADNAAFLETLPHGERRQCRRALRNASGLEIEVRRLDRTGVAEFLLLYESQLAAMGHPIPAARALGGPGPRPLALLDGERTSRRNAGGRAVAKVDTRLDALRVAFTATTPEARRQMVPRALHLAAFEQGRQLGLTWTSSGTDPGRFGASVSLGLFRLKSAMGFYPVPLHHIDPDDDGADDAEMVVQIPVDEAPQLRLCYPPGDGGDQRSFSAPGRWDVLVESCRGANDAAAPVEGGFIATTHERILGCRRDTEGPT